MKQTNNNDDAQLEAIETRLESTISSCDRLITLLKVIKEESNEGNITDDIECRVRIVKQLEVLAEKDELQSTEAKMLFADLIPLRLKAVDERLERTRQGIGETSVAD